MASSGVTGRVSSEPPDTRHELLEPELGVVEEPIATSDEGGAALVERERPLERLTAGLELGDGPLELGEGVVEGEILDPGFGRVSHGAPRLRRAS